MSDERSVTDASENTEKKRSLCRKLPQKRHVIALMGFWCCFTLSSLRTNFSVAMVDMVSWTKVRKNLNMDPYSKEVCHFPITSERPDEEDGPFEWEPKLQGHILASYFYGLAIAHLLNYPFLKIIGSDKILLIGTIIASLCNLLIPVSASNDAFLIILLQAIKGFGQGIMMPAFSAMLEIWFPPVERLRILCFIASGIPVGAFCGNIFSGIICNSQNLGWKYVFYIFGTLGVIWCAAWYFLVRDSSLDHHELSSNPCSAQRTDGMEHSMPLKTVLTSGPFWAYIAIGFASFWALNFYTTVIPLFMGTITKFSIERNGVMSSLPSIFQALSFITATFISDYLLKTKENLSILIHKSAISIGLFSYAACMFLVTFTECNRILIVLILVLALGMTGFSFATVAIIPGDMSPRFAGTLASIMNVFAALSGIISPTLIGYLTQKRQSMQEWAILFYLSSIVCITAVIIFLIYGSNEIQPWKHEDIFQSQNEQPGTQNAERNENMATASDQPILTSRNISSTQSTVDSQKYKDRPWRTASFPDIASPHKPIVRIPFG